LPGIFLNAFYKNEGTFMENTKGNNMQQDSGQSQNDVFAVSKRFFDLRVLEILAKPRA